jgi:chemotaxis protein methyltransferase CheR
MNSLSTLENIEAGRPGFAALQERALRDADDGALLSKDLSHRGPGLFSDTARMAALRKALGPWLRSKPSPKVWIADCACAEEIYPLAILLDEEGVLERTIIFATAAHESILDEVREAEFPAEKFAEYEQNYRRSGGTRSLGYYCRKRIGGRYVFTGELRERITFAQYHLATDASFNEFDFIFCPSALNGLSLPMRQRVLQLFDDSLPVFGMLGISGSDTSGLAGVDVRYHIVDEQQGLYRRIA